MFCLLSKLTLHLTNNNTIRINFIENIHNSTDVNIFKYQSFKVESSGTVLMHSEIGQ